MSKVKNVYCVVDSTTHDVVSDVFVSDEVNAYRAFNRFIKSSDIEPRVFKLVQLGEFYPYDNPDDDLPHISQCSSKIICNGSEVASLLADIESEV